MPVSQKSATATVSAAADGAAATRRDSSREQKALARKNYSRLRFLASANSALQLRYQPAAGVHTRGGGRRGQPLHVGQAVFLVVSEIP